jgi:hypothetical protein
MLVALVSAVCGARRRYLGICSYEARPPSELMLLWSDAQEGA